LNGKADMLTNTLAKAF
jgi:hypothetical protein